MRTTSSTTNRAFRRAVLQRNQYGGTFGGPIVIPHIVDGRNKLFFFFSYQGQKQTQVQLEG